MCGGELVRPRSAESLGDAYADTGAAPQQPAPEAVPEEVPVPFADYGRRGASYLYDDEPSQSHWKLYLLAAVIALAGFVIAYQWGKPNFDTSQILTLWDKLQGKRQEASTSKPASTPESPAESSSNAATAAGASPRSAGTPEGSAPSSNPEQPGQNASAGPSPKADTPAPTPSIAGVQPEHHTGSRGPTEQDIPPVASGPAVALPPPNAAPPSGNAPGVARQHEDSARAEEPESTPAEETSPGDETSSTTPPSREPAEARRSSGAVARKQEQGDRRQRAGDDLLVDTAQNYLYGRGVPRDCDRALTYLRRAADTSARAKTQLGALYATGQCVPRDRPTAYHWLALAFRADPGNSFLERDLQMLWNQMTGEERQRAMRMTP
jgi:hypothetical protein